jgi:hypothetical protein
MAASNPVQEILDGYSKVPELLAQLDAFVREQGLDQTLAAKVAIGVRTESGAKWWMLQLGRSLETTFADTPDRDVHAALLFTAADAEAIAQGKKVERFDTHGFGDRALLKRLLERYLKHTSAIGIRSGS